MAAKLAAIMNPVGHDFILGPPNSWELDTIAIKKKNVMKWQTMHFVV